MSGATAAGFVFWINMAVTGGPCRTISSSYVKIGPIRDISSIRVELSKASFPSTMFLFQLKIILFDQNAPPPKYLNFPPTAAIDATA